MVFETQEQPTEDEESEGGRGSTTITNSTMVNDECRCQEKSVDVL